MNRKTKLKLIALVALSAFVPGINAQDETPVVPVGSLTAFPTIVQTGTHPQLTWDITIPESVIEIIEIEEPGTLIPKRNLVMDVRILGAGVTTYSNNRLNFIPTECKISYNGSSYNRIFYGTNYDVDQNDIVYSQEVAKDSTINFGARYYYNNSWGTWYSSTNSNHNVIALANGDTPPTTTPMNQAPTIEEFIRPYLDDDGNIDIGPRDIIYLFELTHTDQNHSGFDLQDMAVLVTFYDECKRRSKTGTGIGAD